MKRTLVTLTAAVLLALTAGPAAAQEDAKEKANAHVERGQRHQRLGQFDEAIAEYKAAYDLIPHPVLLYNMATAYRLKGDIEQAIHYYEKYIAIETMGSAVDKARAYLTILREEEQKLNENNDEDPDGDGSLTTERSGITETELAPPDDTTETTKTAPEPEITAPPVRDDGDRGGRGMEIGGLATAAAGLVFVGVGVKFGLDARDLEGKVEEPPDGWTDEELARLEDRLEEGAAAERKMGVFLGLGSAAVAGGVVLYVLGKTAANKESQEGFSFDTGVGPRGVNAVVRYRF